MLNELKSPKNKSLSWSEIFILIKDTSIEFASENSLFHGAALSYYTIFALVPILYLSIVSFGMFIGQETMVKIITDVLVTQVGVKDVRGIIEFLNQVNFEKANVALQIIGIVVLLITSTAMLSSLKNSINDFYNIEKVHTSNKKKILATLIDKITHVGLLAVFGLIIIVTYFGQIIILSLGDKVFAHFGVFHQLFVFITQHIVPLLTNTFIFYFIFRYLSDGIVGLKTALAGSIVTSILLYLGQQLIKYYLNNYFFAKDAGIAGTLLILLTWVYYTSQIIFFGAKFTFVYSKKMDQTIVVKP